MQFQRDTSGEDFYALTTFRRDGTAVSTPIWLAPAKGCWYAFTAGRSGKVARLRRDPRVQVAPSDFHGEPAGAASEGTARVLPDAQFRTAVRALTAKYGWKFRFFRLVSWLGRGRRRGGPPVGLEIVLAG
ncbi:PPOX class F420-dependent oxidoreductase [Ruania zhangjianzhongii]|uniref:PPOX class F420-dependent oxidoreductase n=1 Tax=Ruania zhangjianzhongii TaxID=2603206 RepID=UPI001F44A737|nr:PPOX class F420-dependent oxidoreductase [Ruania zhangjianzhongii]